MTMLTFWKCGVGSHQLSEIITFDDWFLVAKWFFSEPVVFSHVLFFPMILALFFCWKNWSQIFPCIWQIKYKVFLICQKHGKIYDHFFTKLKSNVNLSWRQKDFRRQRKVFGKIYFSRKKQLSNHGKIQIFFSRKTNFAKNVFLMSKILLSSKQIYILYLSWEKVVVIFPMFLTK